MTRGNGITSGIRRRRFHTPMAEAGSAAAVVDIRALVATMVTPYRYRKAYLPGHPLGDRPYRGRAVLYDVLSGADADCTWCGTPLSWWVGRSDPAQLVCAYVDPDGGDIPENVRPACRHCAAFRRLRRGHPVEDTA